MTEDITATIRIGVSVSLVAMLVAIVLNLTVVSQSIMSNAQSSLQAGVTQVGLQEFAPYDQQPAGGTAVRSALNLYAQRDTAILICPKSLQDASGKPKGYFNYGAILKGAELKTETIDGEICTYYFIPIDKVPRKGKNAFLSANLDMQSGVVERNGDLSRIDIKGDQQFLLSGGGFRSSLVKDDGSVIVGIAFVQNT